MNKLNLGKTNFIILIIAAVLLAVGYFIMAQNDVFISPIILSLVYVVIIPFALLYKPKDKDKE
ncbi:MAG TPA: hypothetical protein GX398_00725 [Candidatus Cloacimonetes bacterium]|jgi:type IV secretory pathway VirB3-like protein|nr:hypothetical protein [Candidatus Cloacimonas sp.]HHZ14625.1 hypothetical protein [Candidatus Cloacimonadota bacterium]